MTRVDDLMARELERFRAEHPRSLELAEEAGRTLLGGVPMHWMVRWPGGFPVFAAEAKGARFTDVDGHEYVDLCLGDTGAMTGHAPDPTLRAIAEQAPRGITLMLPSEDALWVGQEMQRRFGPAVLAVRADRHRRQPLRDPDRARDHRAAEDPRVQLVLPRHRRRDVRDARRDGNVVAREGNIGPPVPLAETTRVVEFNDVEALRRELSHGDVACVLAEPALTNIGIVLPEPGYHDALRAATRDTGTLLIIDETHTLSAGPGGYTQAHGLEPDLLTIGKPLAGGVPAGAYGFSADVAERVKRAITDEVADTGGIGGTLAANVLQFAAMRATLGEVLTDEAFTRMIALGERFEAGVQQAIDRYSLPGTSPGSAAASSTSSTPSARAPARRRRPPATRRWTG
jgi:glutamate-1-semialdehyde 2,1-aminomutase